MINSNDCMSARSYEFRNNQRGAEFVIITSYPTSEWNNFFTKFFNFDHRRLDKMLASRRKHLNAAALGKASYFSRQ